MKVGQSLTDLADTIVTDLTGHQGERSQVEQTAGNVNQRPEKNKILSKVYSIYVNGNYL